MAIKTSHNKTIRITAAGTYEINSDNEFIIIDTSALVSIYFPHMLKDNDRVNIISLDASPDVVVYDFIGNVITTLTTDYGYIQIEYNTSANTYVSRELVSTGAGGDTGWTNDGGNYSKLTVAGQGIRVNSIDNAGINYSYISVIDTTASSVSADIEDIAVLGLIKNYKVFGENELLLEDFSFGFSTGGNTLIVYDSAIIFFDGNQWQVLYNNEWKTKTVNIIPFQILTLGTIPIELLPAPGVGKYHVIDSILTKYFNGGTAYSTFADLAFVISNQFYNVVSGMITVASDSFKNSVDIFPNSYFLNEALIITTSDFSDPTLGDGTLQLNIKYKTLTF